MVSAPQIANANAKYTPPVVIVRPRGAQLLLLAVVAREICSKAQKGWIVLFVCVCVRISYYFENEQKDIAKVSTPR